MAKIFEVEDGEVIWADSGGVGGFGDGLLDVNGSESSKRSVKGVITVKSSDEFSGQFVSFMVE